MVEELTNVSPPASLPTATLLRFVGHAFVENESVPARGAVPKDV